ncbi:MAG: tetratricopeptide repeat protein [Bacteroidales bacterium]|nr:tetratricopeptide repeat protein [Bacteroidales bacterium]
MPQPINKILQFWQELKRRKVFRVVAMYAASAFILLEVVDIVVPALLLPSWTVTLVIILLAIGFPVAAILSWIFDITPEGVKKTESIEVAKEHEPLSAPAKRRQRASDVIIVVLIVVVGILVYPKIFKKDKFEGIRDADGRISVAVMPFQNMTGDTIWDIWQNGIQNELITNLSNSDELSVRQYQTMNDILQSTKHTNYTSITPIVAGNISRKLDANTFIQGSIKESGDIFRINAQLVDSKTGGIYKTYHIDGNTEDDLFIITDSLSRLVRSYLEIKVLEKELDYDYSKFSTTESPEAYKYYIKGINLFFCNDYSSSVELFIKAIEVDPDFFAAHYFLTGAYYNLRRNDEALLSFQKAYEQFENVSYDNQLLLKHMMSFIDKDPHAGIKYVELFLEDNPQNRIMWYLQGTNYNDIHQFEKATQCFEKSLEISKQWGGGNMWDLFYINPGKAYHELGNHDRENEIYEMGLSVLPDHPNLIFRQAICALSTGDMTEANDYIAKYRSIRETNGWDDDQIKNSVGIIYQMAKQYDKAIVIFRELIAKNLYNPEMKWRLGSIFINNEENVDEGMDLIDQALKIKPDNYSFIDTKGWGLYKQGKLEESLDILKESWEARPYFNSNHYLYIQEVEKAFANQNK